MTGSVAENRAAPDSLAQTAGAAQGRRVVPLATKLDIPTANGVRVAIGLSGGDSGGWRLGPLGRGGSRAEPAQRERLAPHRRDASVHVGDAEPPHSAILVSHSGGPARGAAISLPPAAGGALMHRRATR